MAHQPKIKAHSLTGRITFGLMQEAFKAVKHNRGAAGIDKVSIQMFAANLDQNLHALMRDLKDGSFQPLPLRRHYIPKNETEFRPLGIPAVRDRVAQEVARRLLQPIFEPTFHDASYGFRPGRNCHQAIQAVLEHHQNGLQDVVEADISGFFDNLPFKMRIPMKADTCSNPYRTPFRACRTIVGAKRRSGSVIMGCPNRVKVLTSFFFSIGAPFGATFFGQSKMSSRRLFGQAGERWRRLTSSKLAPPPVATA